MPFLPTSGHDLKELLDAIGIEDVEQLFAGIPEEARCKAPLKVEGPLDELALRRRFRIPAQGPVFLGGGIYRHFIPAVVDAIASRQEFLTAYTPYQPEISQGTLQATFEFQSMMATLTGMDASNASMYDGATALAEAAIMATRAKGVERIVISRATNPAYRGVVQTYFKNNPDVTLVEAPFDPVTGKINTKAAGRPFRRQYRLLHPAAQLFRHHRGHGEYLTHRSQGRVLGHSSGRGPLFRCA